VHTLTWETVGVVVLENLGYLTQQQPRKPGQQPYALYWATHPEESESGVCPVCKANEEASPYELDETLPDYPAHPNCSCDIVTKTR